VSFVPSLALVYDVHGNLPALTAVVEDAREAGIDGFVLGGDYALFGAWPERTVVELRSLPNATWIRGNGERWTADPGEAPDNEVVQGAIAACREALGGPTVAELAALDEQAVIDQTRFCHASPVSDVRSFMPEPADDEPELLSGVSERRLVFGHTHLPFIRDRDGLELVNPGSVGMPFDGDARAAYALLRGGGVEHRRVSYDHESSAAEVQKRFDNAPWTETISRRIRTAQL
jgi:predicted phosphodiesterase